MWSAPEPLKFRSRRRPTLELGMTPLIDIVFLLLIFFMLTSRFVVQEGIQVDLPVTDRSHTLPAEETIRITVRTGGVLVLDGRLMTLRDMDRYLRAQDAAFVQTPFEILADRNASVQTVISLLEMLRDSGAARVTLGTESSSGEISP
jgi:biopolymer transport protein ExbD